VGANGKAKSEQWKYSDACKKNQGEGSWKLAVDIWSSDLPALK